MAHLAMQAEESGVDFWLGVAIYAFPRCACKDLVGMARLAVDLSMFPIQQEYRIVIEIVHPVHPIVAAGAVFSELRHVIRHKPGPFSTLGMAGDAQHLVKGLYRPAMTIVAGQRASIVIGQVAHQAEAGLRLVFEVSTFKFRGCPSSWGVTIRAIAGKHARVRVIILVAAGALPGRALEDWYRRGLLLPAAGASLGMAGSTGNPGMGILEWKSGRLVIEFCHAVVTIVTGDTAFPEIDGVLNSKSQVVAGVTHRTGCN
jgi:hypothetical protein